MEQESSMTLSPLINRPRAANVLAQFGVDALVLADPLNIYHATGFWPLTLEMGQLGTTVAVVPADGALPVILITGAFLYYFQDIGALPADGPVRAIVYTMPGENGEPAPPPFFRPADGGVPDPFERAARAATLDAIGGRPTHIDATSALRDALHEIGEEARLAVDGFVPEAMLGPDFHYRPAEPLLRRIRMIKSPTEIELMRAAARHNADAARAAVASARVGDSYDSLRRAFFAETGLRGGQPAFLQIDSNAYAHRDGIIRKGRAFSIDAVGRYSRYHGDFGRTVFVGEPDPILRRAIEAAINANRAVSEQLRPGLHYSDVMRIGKEACAAVDRALVTPASPHSVGLFHTDEAFRDDMPIFAKADHLIEANMILSIDLPVLQTDMGGTVHLEDLWLVTAEGCEPLNDTAEPILQIGC